MLVGPGVPHDGLDVDPSLVGEGAIADVGLMSPGFLVRQLVDEPRHLPKALQLQVADALQAELQLEVGDDGDEVGVSTPLPIAVDTALDMDGPRLDRYQGVGDG